MTSQFIEEFSFLLDSGRDGIEVSYNAAGVLAHIASDGAEVWSIETPEREHVLERLERAVNRSDKSSFNYWHILPLCLARLVCLTLKWLKQCTLPGISYNRSLILTCIVI